MALNISNKSVTWLDFYLHDEEEKSPIEQDDFELFGLETLYSDDMLPTDYTEGNFFLEYNLVGTKGLSNITNLTTGEVLFAFADLDTDGVADQHIDTIGKNALTDFLKAAEAKHGVGESGYKDALKYLFSRMLTDDKGVNVALNISKLTKEEKAEKLAEKLKDKTPTEILAYFPTPDGGVVSDDLVNASYEMVLRNGGFNIDVRPKSFIKPAGTIKTLTDFQNSDKNDITVDADDFTVFGLYNMAKNVKFNMPTEKRFFDDTANKNIDNTKLSTAEALFGIARNEIAGYQDNDGYANARLDQIGTENLKQYIHIAKTHYAGDKENYKKALAYIFSALLPSSESGRKQAEEMGVHYSTGAGKDKTGADIVAELNSTQDSKITAAEVKKW